MVVYVAWVCGAFAVLGRCVQYAMRFMMLRWSSSPVISSSSVSVVCSHGEVRGIVIEGGCWAAVIICFLVWVSMIFDVLNIGMIPLL